MAEAGARRLVLASTSATRVAMLRAAGLDFEAVAPGVDEWEIKRRLSAGPKPVAPIALATELAAAKAVAVSRRLPDTIVIGADQVLEIDGDMLDKPADLAAARASLLRLRDRTHLLHSGFVIATAGAPVASGLATARMTMRPLDERAIDHYLAAAGPGVCHSVGAYLIEGLGVQLFERIEGDHFTIMGLPLLPLLAELRRLGVPPA